MSCQSLFTSNFFNSLTSCSQAQLALVSFVAAKSTINGITEIYNSYIGNSANKKKSEATFGVYDLAFGITAYAPLGYLCYLGKIDISDLLLKNLTILSLAITTKIFANATDSFFKSIVKQRAVSDKPILENVVEVSQKLAAIAVMQYGLISSQDIVELELLSFKIGFVFTACNRFAWAIPRLWYAAFITHSDRIKYLKKGLLEFASIGTCALFMKTVGPFALPRSVAMELK